MMFCRSFSCLIQVFEFREECIGASFTSEEPLKCRERCIHTTSSIDTWTDLEADDISIIFDYFLSSLEKCPQSMRSRLVHLSKPERYNRPILSYDGHTVRHSSE